MRGSPFSSSWLHSMHKFAWRWGFRPAFDRLDRLLSVLIRVDGGDTTTDWSIARVVIQVVALFALLPVAAITAALVFVWTLPARRPFVLTRGKHVSRAKTNGGDHRAISFLTYNTCCLPDVAARLNALTTMPRRAAFIGQLLATHTADVVALQEVFSPEATESLKAELTGAFTHIMSDVGQYSFRAPLNSGLFIVAADFKQFSRSWGSDAFACKGVLGIKVQLSAHQVGFVFNTHLQAGEQVAARQARGCQLDELCLFMRTFVSRSTLQLDETCAFKVCMGDFNFDNISVDDAFERRHALFDDFIDTGRAAVGVDHPWAIGTCIKKKFLQSATISGDAAYFHRQLHDKDFREQHLEAAMLGDRHTHPAGRRLDLILVALPADGVARESCYVEAPATSLDADFPSGTLSDHLPVTLRLGIN